MLGHRQTCLLVNIVYAESIPIQVRQFARSLPNSQQPYSSTAVDADMLTTGLELARAVVEALCNNKPDSLTLPVWNDHLGQAHKPVICYAIFPMVFRRSEIFKEPLNQAESRVTPVFPRFETDSEHLFYSCRCLLYSDHSYATSLKTAAYENRSPARQSAGVQIITV